MTSGHHVDADLLIDLIEDRLEPEIEQEVSDHIERCPECGVEVDTLRELIGELDKPEVWGERMPEWTMAPATTSSAALAELASRIDREETTGRRIVSVLVGIAEEEWDSALREMSAAPSVGLVKALLAAAHEQLHTDPRLSLSLAEAASRVALSIADATYGASTLALLRASCLKERANSLRLLGRYRAALAALDEAEPLLREVAGGELEIAALDYIRGVIHRDTGEYDLALDLSRAAAETSLTFGDLTRHVHYRMLEATTLSSAGDHAAARETSIELLRLSERSDDLRTTALLLGNIGALSVRLDDENTATIYMRKAADLYARLEMKIPSVRMRWTLASMLVRQNRYQEAEARLAEVAASFRELSLRIEESLVRLELAEILLIESRAAEVELICREVIDLLQNEGVAPAALTALAYLREASMLRRLDLSTVRQARAFLQQLPHESPFLYLQNPSR